MGSEAPTLRPLDTAPTACFGAPWGALGPTLETEQKTMIQLTEAEARTIADLLNLLADYIEADPKGAKFVKDLAKAKEDLLLLQANTAK